VGLAVVFQEVAGHPVDLHGQLPGGGDDNGARPVPGHELGVVHQLQARDQERQRLSGACTSECVLGSWAEF